MGSGLTVLEPKNSCAVRRVGWPALARNALRFSFLRGKGLTKAITCFLQMM